MAKDTAIVHHPDRRTDVTEQDDLNRAIAVAEDA